MSELFSEHGRAQAATDVRTAQVANFCLPFRATLQLPAFTTRDLEAALATGDASIFVADLHMRLMRGMVPRSKKAAAESALALDGCGPSPPSLAFAAHSAQ